MLLNFCWLQAWTDKKEIGTANVGHNSWQQNYFWTRTHFNFRSRIRKWIYNFECDFIFFCVDWDLTHAVKLNWWYFMSEKWLFTSSCQKRVDDPICFLTNFSGSYLFICFWINSLQWTVFYNKVCKLTWKLKMS